MKQVRIFGGFGSRIKHFNAAIEVYKAYGYSVHYVENNNVEVVVPYLHKSKIDRLEHTNPYIIQMWLISK